MRKIKTIFVRDEKSRKVINQLNVDFDFSKAIATEKIDGTNVRITVRSGIAVRVEKRRNPSKEQKHMGIIEPWYVDANREDNADIWIFRAVDNTDLSKIPDGEWSAEAFGEGFQGNPLKMDGSHLFFFSLEEERKKITFDNVPTSFEQLEEWLPRQKSIIGTGIIEGIVWHNWENGDMVKIKKKDFYFVKCI